MLPTRGQRRRRQVPPRRRERRCHCCVLLPTRNDPTAPSLSPSAAMRTTTPPRRTSSPAPTWARLLSRTFATDNGSRSNSSSSRDRHQPKTEAVVDSLPGASPKSVAAGLRKSPHCGNAIGVPPLSPSRPIPPVNKNAFLCRPIESGFSSPMIASAKTRGATPNGAFHPSCCPPSSTPATSCLRARTRHHALAPLNLGPADAALAGATSCPPQDRSHPWGAGSVTWRFVVRWLPPAGS